MKLSEGINKQWKYFRTGLLMPAAVCLIIKNQYFTNIGKPPKKTPLLDRYSNSAPSNLIRKNKKNKNRLPLSTNLGIMLGGFLPLGCGLSLLAHIPLKVIDDTPQPQTAIDTQGQYFTLTPYTQSSANAESKFVVITREQAVELGLLEAKSTEALDRQ